MFERKAPHPADDVYALAIVAYQLLSGRHPFDGQPAPQARHQIREPAPNRGLKRREWRALRRGLAFDRESRSQHAAEFLRELEGGSRLKLVAGIAVLIGVVFAGYVGYVQFQESVRAAPDIPFEHLPGDTRNEINRLVSESTTFRRFGDPGSALALLREAYDPHPRNQQVVAELESLLGELTQRAVDTADSAVLQRLRENLEVVMSTDDFLDTRPALVRANRTISAALAGSN
jgi:serine/threonine protein kinase